jgi:hypothetical protein
LSYIKHLLSILLIIFMMNVKNKKFDDKYTYEIV